ncbi:MAG: EthD family reductase [Candidatus Rokubacteria bacterium]|nr:EthD family reductase [Candidatus Rokubacteria bacterium]
MICLSVLYSNESGKKFDLTYFQQKHMPMVAQRLKDFGFVRYEIARGMAGGAPGSPAPYVCIVHVYLRSAEELQKGLGVHGKEIMGDVPNYTDIKPQMQLSEVVG